MAGVTVWRVGPPSDRWTVDMLLNRVSTLSTAPQQFAVAADSNGLPLDPIAAGVLGYAAFLPDTGRPTDPDWIAGAWDVSRIGQFTLNVPTDSLTAGEYYAWIKLVNDPETYVSAVGTLFVS